MMRRLLPVLALLVLAAAPAHAGKAAPCTVAPDPVSLSADATFTVTATGGAPTEFYEVIVSQRHDGVTDEGRDWLGQADESGTVTAVVQVESVPGQVGSLTAGDASVSVVRYRTGGGAGGGASTIARCGFVVIA